MARSDFDEKKYTVDTEPVSANELIQLAVGLDEKFANDWLRSTSVAANILREHGHEVGTI